MSTIRALLSGEAVSAHAEGLHLDGVQLAVTPSRPVPIYVAAIGPKALRLAGAVADGVLLNAYMPAAYVRFAVEEVRRGAIEAGRDPDAVEIACMLVTRLTDDAAALRAQLRRRLAGILGERGTGEVLLDQGGFDRALLEPVRAALASGDQDAVAALVSDELVEACVLLGDADRCRERIEEYRDAGVDRPLLLPRLPDFARVAEALAP